MQMTTDQNLQQIDIDDLLLELHHQLIDLSHAIEHRFDRESLSQVLSALLKAQPTLNAACTAVANHSRLS